MDYLPQKCMQVCVCGGRGCVCVNPYRWRHTWQMCVCVSDIVSLPAPCGDFPALALVLVLHFVFSFRPVVVVFVFLFPLLCAPHKLWATSNLHMYCHCYCYSICIYACRTRPPTSLPLFHSAPHAHHLVSEWKRTLCAVQPRICTFYGHVYGLQLIDYAWAEWTMPEMCKCSNAAHPLLLPPTQTEIAWRQRKAPPLCLPLSLFAALVSDLGSVAPHGHLGSSLRIAIHTPQTPSRPPLATAAASGYVMNSICSHSRHPGFDLPLAFVRAFAGATRC